MSYSDYAEVAPGLILGAHPEPEDPFELGADVVVCLAAGTSARAVPRNGVLVHWPIKDGPVPDADTLRGVARLIDGCVRSGQVVFVHCQAGMNRSALVVARALMEQGMGAREAIDRVRDRRHGSLSYEYADWLLSEDSANTRVKAGTQELAKQPRSLS
jgi:protein-tyrosine phosphatase